MDQRYSETLRFSSRLYLSSVERNRCVLVYRTEDHVVRFFDIRTAFDVATVDHYVVGQPLFSASLPDD